MAYYYSNFGTFAPPEEYRDMDGYIPEAGDDPEDFNYDHGNEQLRDADGELTEYGEWWFNERWLELVQEAVLATKKAEKALAKWRAE